MAVQPSLETASPSPPMPPGIARLRVNAASFPSKTVRLKEHWRYQTSYTSDPRSARWSSANRFYPPRRVLQRGRCPGWGRWRVLAGWSHRDSRRRCHKDGCGPRFSCHIGNGPAPGVPGRVEFVARAGGELAGHSRCFGLRFNHRNGRSFYYGGIRRGGICRGNGRRRSVRAGGSGNYRRLIQRRYRSVRNCRGLLCRRRSRVWGFCWLLRRQRIGVRDCCGLLIPRRGSIWICLGLRGRGGRDNRLTSGRGCSWPRRDRYLLYRRLQQ